MQSFLLQIGKGLEKRESFEKQWRCMNMQGKKKNNNVYAEDSGGEENSLTTKHITEGCQIG